MEPHADRSTPVVRLVDVSFVRDRRRLLSGVDWEVRAGERWVVLGPNGAGKSTLLRLLSTYALPSSGRVEVLGHRVGGVDLRTVVRPRVGLVSPALERDLALGTSALDAVLTGVDATLRLWRQTYRPADRDRAERLLAELGCGHLARAPVERLSDGERRRVLIARAMIARPALLLLDEPCANLDLGGREQVLGALEQLASASRPAGSVLVTHHLEEVPRGTTHALLLRDGRVVARGRIEQVLTSDAISGCFDVEVAVERGPDGRYRTVAT